MSDEMAGRMPASAGQAIQPANGDGQWTWAICDASPFGPSTENEAS